MAGLAILLKILPVVFFISLKKQREKYVFLLILPGIKLEVEDKAGMQEPGWSFLLFRQSMIPTGIVADLRRRQ